MNRYVFQAHCLVTDAEIDLRLNVNLLLHCPTRTSSLVLSLLPATGLAMKSLIITKQEICIRCPRIEAERKIRSLDLTLDDRRQPIHKHPRSHSGCLGFVPRCEFAIAEKRDHPQRLKYGIADNSVDLICALAQAYIQVGIV